MMAADLMERQRQILLDINHLIRDATQSNRDNLGRDLVLTLYAQTRAWIINTSGQKVADVLVPSKYIEWCKSIIDGKAAYTAGLPFYVIPVAALVKTATSAGDSSAVSLTTSKPVDPNPEPNRVNEDQRHDGVDHDEEQLHHVRDKNLTSALDQNQVGEQTQKGDGGTGNTEDAQEIVDDNIDNSRDVDGHDEHDKDNEDEDDEDEDEDDEDENEDDEDEDDEDDEDKDDEDEDDEDDKDEDAGKDPQQQGHSRHLASVKQVRTKPAPIKKRKIQPKVKQVLTARPRPRRRTTTTQVSPVRSEQDEEGQDRTAEQNDMQRPFDQTNTASERQQSPSGANHESTVHESDSEETVRSHDTHKTPVMDDAASNMSPRKRKLGPEVKMPANTETQKKRKTTPSRSRQSTNDDAQNFSDPIKSSPSRRYNLVDLTIVPSNAVEANRQVERVDAVYGQICRLPAVRDSEQGGHRTSGWIARNVLHLFSGQLFGRPGFQNLARLVNDFNATVGVMGLSHGVTERLRAAARTSNYPTAACQLMQALADLTESERHLYEGDALKDFRINMARYRLYTVYMRTMSSMKKTSPHHDADFLVYLQQMFPRPSHQRNGQKPATLIRKFLFYQATLDQGVPKFTPAEIDTNSPEWKSFTQDIDYAAYTWSMVQAMGTGVLALANKGVGSQYVAHEVPSTHIPAQLTVHRVRKIASMATMTEVYPIIRDSIPGLQYILELLKIHVVDLIAEGQHPPPKALIDVEPYTKTLTGHITYEARVFEIVSNSVSPLSTPIHARSSQVDIEESGDTGSGGTGAKTDDMDVDGV